MRIIRSKYFAFKGIYAGFGRGLAAIALVALGCSDKAARQAALSAGSSAAASGSVAAAPVSGVAASAGKGAAGTPATSAVGGAAGAAGRVVSSAGSVAQAGSGGNPSTLDDADAGTPDSGTAQPMTAQPMTTQPMTTQPMTTQPMTTQPMTTEPTVACPATALRPGDTRSTVMHEGRMREFLIHVPSGYDNTRPVPLVLNFHGATMTAEQQRDFSGMNATSDAKGFVVVYPQGVGNSWNAGVCCGEAQSSNVDDVGFARAMLDALQKNLCIDKQRTYSAGFSNGGRMSYRLGCELAEVFAAIAPVAGTKSFPDDMNTPGCKPSQPISLIDIMGSADPRSAAQPGQIAEWVAFNGCSDASPTESYRKGPHFCSTYSQCQDATSITYCVVDGGDHCWPGSYPCILGNTSRPEELSANDLIWELFERSKR